MSVKWFKTNYNIGGYVENNTVGVVCDNNYSYSVIVNKTEITEVQYEMMLVKVDAEGTLVNSIRFKCKTSLEDNAGTDNFAQFAGLRLVGEYLYLGYMTPTDFTDNIHEPSGSFIIHKLDKDLNIIADTGIIPAPSGDEAIDTDHQSVMRFYVRGNTVYTALLFEKEDESAGDSVYFRLSNYSVDDLSQVGADVFLNCNTVNNGIVDSEGDVVVNSTTLLTTVDNAGDEDSDPFGSNTPLSDVYVGSSGETYLIYRLVSGDDEFCLLIISKIDSDGSTVWSKLLVDPIEYDEDNIEDNSFYMKWAIGNTDINGFENLFCGYNNADRNGVVSKIDVENGNRVWTTVNTVDDPEKTDTEKDVVCDCNGDVYMASIFEEFGENDVVRVAKYNGVTGRKVGYVDYRNYIVSGTDGSQDDGYLALMGDTMYLLLREYEAILQDVDGIDEFTDDSDKYDAKLVKIRLAVYDNKMRNLIRNNTRNLEDIQAIKMATQAMVTAKQYNHKYFGRYVSGSRTYNKFALIQMDKASKGLVPVGTIYGGGNYNALTYDYYLYLVTQEDYAYFYNCLRESMFLHRAGKVNTFRIRLHFSHNVSKLVYVSSETLFSLIGTAGLTNIL